MQKTKLFLTMLIAVVLYSGATFGQKQQAKEKHQKDQSEVINPRIDNMGYWGRMAKKGLVPVAPAIPNAPAINTGSQIKAFSVLFDDSPDVPVTDLTNVTETENSSFVDPNNTDYILNSNNSTSWNGGSVGVLYGANFFQSEDGGLTWGGSAQGAGGGNSGDPTTAIGLNGREYINFINNPGGMGLAYSDNGTSWTTKTIAPNPGSLADKNHMWIDNSATSPYEGNLYVAWTDFGGPYDQNVVISRSTDDGDNWSARQAISGNISTFDHGVNLQTGPNGEVYACWATYPGSSLTENGIGFTKSTDGGVTFSPAVKIISNIQGIREIGTSKNHRVNSFPVMTVDISGGQYNGNIYVTWVNKGVPGVNTGNDIDVYMIRSEDGGATWSDPIKINQDDPGQGKEHYSPWIVCDPETGILSAIFYDDRNVSSSQCEVFCANSFDAGETWEDFKVSDVAFTPSPIPGLANGYMGDYISITARGSFVYPVWGDNRNGLYMTYVSPYVTNNRPKPTDLVVDLDEETGGTSLTWNFEEKDFLYFNVYRDNELLGTTTETAYTDNLPDYGVYTYMVTAMHDDGESTGAGASIQWGNPHININADAVIENLLIGASSSKTITIQNVGELQLDYNIGVEITSDKGIEEYCSASGGGDEFISGVVLGDINNTSGSNNYADYTDQSTMVNMGESYDITVTNGNVYTADDLGVWIDWNQDDDFDDAGESVVCESGNSGEGTYSFTIPNTAVPGETTLRIRIKYSGDDCGDPCGSTQYGEVEDYSLYILGWLIVDPTEGQIAAGESEDITLNFDASDLEEGVYTANLNISSNDPDVATTVIPVTLNVGEDIPTVIATADPSDICAGESVQLNAQANGGSGTFTYSWTSDPEGFTSDIADPIVDPEVTTSYFVHVFDGLFTVMDTVIVTVAPFPSTPAMPEGEMEFCQGSENMEYKTLQIENANSYSWMIDPVEAGTVTGSDTLAMVNWSMDFSGNATISVAGMNDCGEGDYSDGLSVSINTLPEISITLTSDSVCVYNENFILEGGLPANGEFSGDFVTDGEFSPEEAGVGTHIITYTYTDGNGCTNMAETELYVGECLGIDEFANNIQVELYPNPNNGVFTLNLSTDGNEVVNIRVLNNIGEEVYKLDNITVNNSYKNELNLSKYSEGLYFIHISSGDSYYLKKILVRK